MAYNLSNFNTNYVKENAEQILPDTVLAAPSLDEFTKMPDVHCETKLNIMDNSVVFQDGSACGFNAQGSTTLSQRSLVPGTIKVNMNWCHKDLLKTVKGIKVNIRAGEEEMADEQLLMNDIMVKIANQLEHDIWQGSIAGGQQFDGIGTITAGITLSRTSDIVADVENVYKSIPEEQLDNAVIYMSKNNFRAYVLALGAKNLYHYDPKIDGDWTVTIPNTNTIVKGISGLKGANDIYAFNPEHMVYGFSTEDDYATAKMWYSEDNDEFRFNCQFVAGVQYAFPANMVKMS
ncbi:MAG: hypothetical protein KBS62_06885 [Oscillospiraceae bacterium]|nr:hypothetical protein [Candidatus Ruminococcus equi]